MARLAAAMPPRTCRGRSRRLPQARPAPSSSARRSTDRVTDGAAGAAQKPRPAAPFGADMARRTKLTGFVTALVAAALLPAIPTARAQVITNTESAHWTHDGEPGQALSNRVDVTVTARPPEQPTITTYRLTSGGGNKSVPLAPTPCERPAARSATSTIPLSGVYEGISTAPASLQSTDNFRAGEVLVVGVTLASANVDPQQRDILSVALELENGDREQITLTETANDSGEFVGFINTIGVPPAVVQGDCRLSVNPGAPLALRVTDRASARRFPAAGSRSSTQPPANPRKCSATTVYPPIRRASSRGRASPMRAARHMISRRATIAFLDRKSV